MRLGLYYSAVGLISLVALGGCSSTSSTGVIEVGKDTYTIVVQGKSRTTSPGELKKVAYREANTYCQVLGKKMQPVSTSSEPGTRHVFPTFELTFRPVHASHYREPPPESATTVEP